MPPNLPDSPSAQRIVDAVGWDLALTVIARWGGRRLHLARGEPGPEITTVLGLDAARLLCASLGPGDFEVPRAVSWLIAQRNLEVFARALSGETHAELSQRFGLTERQVRRILANQPKEPA